MELGDTVQPSVRATACPQGDHPGEGPQSCICVCLSVHSGPALSQGLPFHAGERMLPHAQGLELTEATAGQPAGPSICRPSSSPAP